MTFFICKKGYMSETLSEMPEIFKNRSEVFEFLKAQGNKLSRAKLYRDVSIGKLPVQKDGTILKKDLTWYIKHPASNLIAGPVAVAGSSNLDDMQIRKIEADIKKSEAQALLAEKKAGMLSGQLVDKDLFYGEIAARSAVFKSDLINFFRAKASDMIAIVSGDQKKATDLMEFCIYALEAAISRYSEEKEWKVSNGIVSEAGTGGHDDDDDD